MSSFSESERHGLFMLHPRLYEPDGYSIDIIAVHGLNGHPFRTWTDPTSHHLWLRDSLPNHIPEARILTFGYDSGVLFSRSRMRLTDFSQDLLSRLHLKRQAPAEKKRPILFVCHSLGGIVAKQALVLASLRKDTYGDISSSTTAIAFFGTPHRGSRSASSGLIMSRILNAASFGTAIRSASSGLIMSRILNAASFGTAIRSDLVKGHEVSSRELENISILSIQILSKLNIVSFYEQKPLGPSLIVEPFSAVLGLPTERAIPVNADHRDIARVSPRLEHRYFPVWASIKELVDRALAPAAVQTDVLLTNLFCVDYKTAQLRPRQAHDATCNWVFENSVFQNWLRSDKCDILLLTGPPGSGKTVLTRYIVEEILSGRQVRSGHSAYVAASFFCSYNDKANNSEEVVLRSILHQLIQLNPRGAQLVHNKLSVRRPHGLVYEVTLSKLWKSIDDILAMDAMANTFIGIDAIEELGAEDATHLLAGFAKIMTRLNYTAYTAPRTIRVLFSSRSSSVYRKAVLAAPVVHMDRSQLEHSIRVFVAESIRELSVKNADFARSIEPRRDALISKISTRADGMFLWATIAWEGFCRGFLWNRDVVDEKLQELDSTPQGINPLYERMIQKVDPSIRRDMWTLFSILAVAKRPLKALELGTALAMTKVRPELGINPVDVEPFESLIDIIDSKLSDFVTIHNDGTVTFSHLSVKEYIIQMWTTNDPDKVSNANRMVTVACLSYLEHYDAVLELIDEGKRAGFLNYACSYHIDHLLLLPPSDPLWLRYADTATSPYFSGSWMSPLQSILDSNMNRTMMLELIHQFVAHGYDINRRETPSQQGSALNHCCLWAHNPSMTEAALLLLDLGADPNLFPKGQESNLFYAIKGRHTKLIDKFLGHPDINLDMKDSRGHTPLHYMIEVAPFSAILSFLDAHDVEVNVQSNLGITPLHLAVTLGRVDVVRRLLGMNGIRLDLVDNDGRTPLALATFWGLKQVSLAMIKQSHAFPIPEADRLNSLLMAAMDGDKELTLSLLPSSRYRNLNYHIDKSGKSLLHHAAMNNWAYILEKCLTLGEDVNINQIDHSGGTALHYAASLGCTETCTLLLKFRASVRLQNRLGRTAVQAAADAGFKDTLQVLVDQPSLDPNQRDHQGRNLIHWAATLDFVDVMQKICQFPDAQFARKDCTGKMPIDYAFICQCPDVGRYLSLRMRLRASATVWNDPYDWNNLRDSPTNIEPRVLGPDSQPELAAERERFADMHRNRYNEEWERIHRYYAPERWALVELSN